MNLTALIAHSWPSAGSADLPHSGHCSVGTSVPASAPVTVLPVFFTSAGLLPNGQFQLSFAGVAGSNYVLLATTNFASWTPLMTNLAVTNLFNLMDPKASNFPYRFYRVRQLP